VTTASGSPTPATPPAVVLAQWLITSVSPVGKHSLVLMTEVAGVRAVMVNEIRDSLRSHYVAPAIAAKRLADLGAPKTAQLLREHLPVTKTARSGDLGEVLATEIAEQTLGFEVPVRRLRWKDGRNMALRGDDIVGLRDVKGKLEFLKGESKSRAALTTAVLEEAGEALDRDRGRPSRHSVIFVAERLRELGNDQLATRLENAALESFAGSRVEHLLLALTGGNPANLLTAHLSSCATKRRLRHAVGVRIIGHGAFIDDLFGGL
jgi:Cap4 SAVED domain